MTSSSRANKIPKQHHMKRPLRLALSLGAGLCMLTTALPGDAVWHWMRGAAVPVFSESDWVLLNEAAQDMLDTRPDREQVNWSNPDTGNRGSLIVLATFSHDGQVCRRAAMRNLTFRGRDEKAAYSLCQQEDGTWQFVAESALLDEASTSPG